MIKTQQPQQAKQVPQQQPQYFKKRIGSTIYKVAVHSSNTSKENIEDKILRLAKNDIANLTQVPTAKRAVGI
jgi:hypothetical protein